MKTKQKSQPKPHRKTAASSLGPPPPETAPPPAPAAAPPPGRCRPPSEFKHLAEAALERVHDYIYNSTYKEAQEKILELYNIHISTNKLWRYKQRLDLADNLSHKNPGNPKIRRADA